MRHAIIMLACLASLPAYAQEPTRYTYHDMLKQLRSSGIEPAQVAWGEVNPLCTGFMNYKDDPTEQNRCLYQKATLAVAHATDRETCNIEALAATPSSMRTQPAAIIAEYNPGPGNDSLTTITTPRLSRTELKTLRAATYNRCMRDFGWQSPRNWRLGYSD